MTLDEMAELADRMIRESKGVRIGDDGASTEDRLVSLMVTQYAAVRAREVWGQGVEVVRERFRDGSTECRIRVVPLPPDVPRFFPMEDT